MRMHGKCIYIRTFSFINQAMLFLGILLIILVFPMSHWASGLRYNALSGSGKGWVLFLILTMSPFLVWGLGVYILWSFSPIISLIVFLFFSVLVYIAQVRGSKKFKAKKIFRIYRDLESYCPAYNKKTMIFFDGSHVITSRVCLGIRVVLIPPLMLLSSL